MSVIATKILFYLLSLLKWHLSFQRIPESHRQAQSRSEARLVLIVLEVIEKTFQTTVRPYLFRVIPVTAHSQINSRLPTHWYEGLMYDLSMTVE